MGEQKSDDIKKRSAQIKSSIFLIVVILILLSLTFIIKWKGEDIKKMGIFLESNEVVQMYQYC